MPGHATARTVLSETEGGIRTITLNRPERLNAINHALIADFNSALDDAAGDDATRVIILRGAGRAFCAGDDLKEFDEQTGSEAKVTAMVESLQDITRKIVLGEKIVIGAIHGWAVGGGLEWAIDCDFPIWAETARAFFPEISLGLFVTGAVTTLLPKLIGPQKTKDLILFGEKFDGRAAFELGIAWKTVPEDQLFAEAVTTAKRILELPQAQVRDLKRVVNRACHLDVEAAMALETAATVRGFLDPATAERIGGFTAQT
ncbi:MAG: enoyl-CoA hydratase/isomerase family protein [Alphaproteobacteria bacterium]|nr:enoyl-CoA hydratase/isomerase family protein [Alphaproteobacteria bacterium]